MADGRCPDVVGETDTDAFSSSVTLSFDKAY
jgi:hypothetical protein